jgi:hypothetical protein
MAHAISSDRETKMAAVAIAPCEPHYTDMGSDVETKMAAV